MIATYRPARILSTPRRRLAAVTFAALCASFIALGGQARANSSDSGKMLEGSDLRRAVAGKRIYLSTPFGGEFPLFYRADGRVDGSGEAVGLGRFLKPSDSGRWWVDGGRLCQQWQTWYDGKVFCFRVSEKGPGRIGWVRDDGEKGIARVSD
jgi:hypothetical protein